MKRVAWLVLMTLLASGCGDRTLWARWGSDRLLWRAARADDARPANSGRAADEARIEAGLQAVLDAYPAARWASPPAASGPAREVARNSSKAALRLASRAAARGDDTLALARFAGVLAGFGLLPGAALAARVGELAPLERLGRYDEALAVRTEVARMDPLGNPDRSEPAAEILAAPLQVAREWIERGQAPLAARVLLEAESRLAAELPGASPGDAVVLAGALGALRAARRDAPGALAALREGLRRGPRGEQPWTLLAMASTALEAGAPDSAFVYARWVCRISAGRRTAGAALLLIARAFEATGRPDSALAYDEEIFRRWNDPGELGPEARFQGARISEDGGEWERARAGYRALAARWPTHPRAFESLRRIVQHDLDRGADEMARAGAIEELDHLGRLLSANRDPDVQRLARATRAELLLALGRPWQAESTLVDLWRAFPQDSLAEDAALRAAELAAHRPGGRAAAARRLEELGRTAANAAVRRSALERAAAPPAR